jgi:hypothetical protein
MWQKLAEKLLKWFLIPLIKDGINWAVKKVKEYFRKRKLKKDNDKKVQKYEKANNADDARDSFSKLP